MRFNLTDLNPPAWFEHPNHKGSKICLRVCASSDLERIHKDTMKKKVEYRRGNRFEVEKIDEKKRSDLTWIFCIVDWERIFDEDGNEIECTDENKILLMQQAPTFTSWVASCLEELNEDDVTRQEDAEKN